MMTTLQSPNFGRAYFAFGGVPIIISNFLDWKSNGLAAGKLDITGGIIALTVRQF